MAGKAEVYYDSSLVSPQSVCDWITSLGFPSSLQNGDVARTREHEEVELNIGGMTCSSCVYNIESHVSNLNGVIKARVALATQKGVFTYDPDRIGPRNIIDQIIVSLN